MRLLTPQLPRNYLPCTVDTVANRDRGDAEEQPISTVAEPLTFRSCS